MSVEVKPFAHKKWTFRQSRSEQCPEVPFRLTVVAPSGQGKTVLLQSLVLNPKLYRGCFERIYIFSPSCDIDSTWDPVKKYIKEELRVDTRKEPCWWPDYEPEVLESLISTQFKIIEHLKASGQKALPSILILVDDHADNEAFTRRCSSLWTLFTRGRHAGISTIISGQRLCSVAPIIRLNCSGIIVFALRNMLDLQKFVEELGAVCEDKDDILQMYRIATSKPHGFLYVDLMARGRERMFLDGFSRRLVPTGDRILVRPV
jgi:hypothetical protein